MIGLLTIIASFAVSALQVTTTYNPFTGKLDYLRAESVLDNNGVNGTSLNISSLIIANLINCDTINTTASGELVCGDDAAGAGGGGAGDKWIDAGSYIYPNGTFANNVVVFGYVKANDWTNVSITESQISDLQDYSLASSLPNITTSDVATLIISLDLINSSDVLTEIAAQADSENNISLSDVTTEIAAQADSETNLSLGDVATWWVDLGTINLTQGEYYNTTSDNSNISISYSPTGAAISFAAGITTWIEQLIDDYVSTNFPPNNRTDEDIEDTAGAMFTGNTETGITVTYQDGDGTTDFVVTDNYVDTTGDIMTGELNMSGNNIVYIGNSKIFWNGSCQIQNNTETGTIIALC